jgi:hypothetical protein
LSSVPPYFSLTYRASSLKSLLHATMHNALVGAGHDTRRWCNVTHRRVHHHWRYDTSVYHKH